MAPQNESSFTKYIERYQPQYDEILAQTSEHLATLLFMLTFVYDLKGFWLYNLFEGTITPICSFDRNLQEPKPTERTFRQLLDRAIRDQKAVSDQQETTLPGDNLFIEAFAVISFVYDGGPKMLVLCRQDILPREAAMQEFAFTSYELKDYESVIETFVEAHERKRELQQKEQVSEVGALAASITHEIEDLVHGVVLGLGTVKGYIDDLSLLIGEIGNNGDFKFSEDQIMRGKMMILEMDSALRQPQLKAERLHYQLEALQEYTKTEPWQLWEVDVNRVLEKALTVVDRKLKFVAKKTIDFSPDPGIVRGSPVALLHAFVHILDNAVDAVEEKGQIIVKTYRENDSCCVQIKDNGRGIPTEHLDNVFRLDFTTKKDVLGLGLHLTRRIIHAQGGSIALQSEPGEGVTVIVKLPCHDSPLLT